MKVDLYMDIYPYMKNPSMQILASNFPGSKHSGCKRYLIQVEIPDPAEPDRIIEAEAKEVEH